MSCVLRISAGKLPAGTLVPYRVERGAAHFEVSSASFANLAQQIVDAIAFLHSYEQELKHLMGQPEAIGVLDFAVEWRDVAVQSDAFPVQLVRAAGALGLSLEFSHYPRAEPPCAEA
jgi:hypothetical protein